jgi:hypothetical protein
MKNPESKAIILAIAFCAVGFIMLAVANPQANPVIINWESEAWQGITGGFGGIFVYTGFILSLARMFFISQRGSQNVQ